MAIDLFAGIRAADGNEVGFGDAGSRMEAR
jgi:hypothetical protein